jgi:5-methyltetrahydrofolate--homocysteine methyltransferase
MQILVFAGHIPAKATDPIYMPRERTQKNLIVAPLNELTAAIAAGKRKDAVRLTQELLDAGTDPSTIVENGLVPGMAIVGEKFKNNEIFVPEMLIAARSMKSALALVEPILADSGVKAKYTVVVGTVQGDLHDIGKNLVSMMWKGAGFEVVDLGTNVSPDQYLEAAKEHNPDLIGLSALLTTTMPAMRETIEHLRAAGIEAPKIMVGGAPITEQFANEIGADGYAADAGTAVEIANGLVGEVA